MLRRRTAHVILVVAFAGFASLTACTPNAENAEVVLRLDDIEGQWHGTQGDVANTISWNAESKYVTLRQEYPSTTIAASLVPLPKKDTGEIDLRLDYKDVDGNHSVMIATVKRDTAGKLLLSVLPDAIKIDPDYRLVQDVAIRAQKKHDEEGA